MSLSRAASVREAASASAAAKVVPCAHLGSVKGGGLRRGRAVGADDDLVDARLRLAQLRLAMALQQRAALIRRDRLVELVAAGLEPLDDLLELLQGVLEAHRGDVGRETRIGHDPSPKTGETLKTRRPPGKRGSCYAPITSPPSPPPPPPTPP